MRGNLSRGIGVIDPLARDVHNAEQEPTSGEENSQKKTIPTSTDSLEGGNFISGRERLIPRGIGIKRSKPIAQTSAHPTDSFFFFF